LRRWLEQKDDLLAGRSPRPKSDEMVVGDLLNRFLASKKHLVDTGELSPRTFRDYHATCQNIEDAFGLSRAVEDLASDDFERLRQRLAGTRGLVALGNEIQRVRVIFNYAVDNGLVEKPIRYGQAFKRPSKKALQRVRRDNGPKVFEAAQIRAMLDAAGVPLKAMIFLGINSGFGNNDCATLPLKAVDLEAGWIDYPRPKTGIERRCPLWSETIATVREAIAVRPEPRNEDNAPLVFVTKRGLSWSKDTQDNPISKEMAKLMGRLGIHRKGISFYALRHTFRTIADETRDQPAIDRIMGHVRNDMASVCRERIGDDRLRAVTDHVRKWLFESEDGA
jgi:integrase